MDLKTTLKKIKLNESTISMVLGAIVIVVVGVLLVNYFSGRGETTPSIQVGDETMLPTTHTVSEGEELWSISESYYGTGYNWIDIADANGITNPNQIEVGQEITIPDVEPRVIAEEPTTSPVMSEEVTATPTSEPQTITRDDETVHVVARGEHLWAVAERYYDSGYNWVDIADANDLANPGQLETGQELVIPEVEPKKATVEVPEVAGETEEAISGATYEVNEGDTLWDVAVRAYGDGFRWTEIAQENNLEKPGIIHPGNVLTLPR